MLSFSFNLAKNGLICEKTDPQKLVTKNRHGAGDEVRQANSAGDEVRQADRAGGEVR